MVIHSDILAIFKDNLQIGGVITKILDTENIPIFFSEVPDTKFLLLIFLNGL